MARKTLFYGGVIGMGILFLAIIAPLFLPESIIGHVFLTIEVRVFDQGSGNPVTSAEVCVLDKSIDIAKLPGWPGVRADSNGICRLEYPVVQTTDGKRGKTHLSDQAILFVRANGFRLWEKPLAAVFGKSPEYSLETRTVSCEVRLEK